MLELLYLQTWHHLIPGMALGLQGVVWGPPPPNSPPSTSLCNCVTLFDTVLHHECNRLPLQSGHILTHLQALQLGRPANSGRLSQLWRHGGVIHPLIAVCCRAGLSDYGPAQSTLNKNQLGFAQPKFASSIAEWNTS